MSDDLPIEEEIIAMSVLNCERLPMLDVIFERFALSLSSTLRAYTSAPVSVMLDRVNYSGYGRAMRMIPDLGLIGIAQAEPWEGSLAIVLEKDFVFAALDTMLGGSSEKASSEKRGTFTQIERDFAREVCQLSLDQLSENFTQVGQVQFKVKRIEVNPQLATIAQEVSPVARARLKITFGTQDCYISIVIPHGTLDPIRSHLSKVFLGEKIGGDENWRNHMRTRVGDSGVKLRAVFHRKKVTLKEVMSWSPGSSLSLFLDDGHEASIECEGAEIFKGRVGHRSNGNIAIQITKDLQRAQDGDARGEAGDQSKAQATSEGEEAHVHLH